MDSCLQRGLQELLTALVHGFTLLYGPLVVVLDDLHLFDTASWQLLANITQHAPAVLVVAALRPNDGMLAPSISPDVSWPSGAAEGCVHCVEPGCAAAEKGTRKTKLALQATCCMLLSQLMRNEVPVVQVLG